MEKISNINFNGRMIAFDEKALQTFQDYEKALKNYFHDHEDAEEILSDLHNRISEIFYAQLSKGKTFIAESDVAEVIATLGHPKDFDEEEQPVQTEDTQQSGTGSAASASRGSGKYYRNSNDKVLSGVCSGLANLLGIDPLSIRLLYVLFSLANPPIGILVYVLVTVFTKSKPLAANFTRKLYRHPKDKVIAGVCGGLAEFFHTRALVIRLAFIFPFVMMFFDNWFGSSVFGFPFFGMSIITYVLLWMMTDYAKTNNDFKLLKGEPITLDSYTQNFSQPQITHSAPNGLNVFLKIVVFIIMGICLMIFIPVALGTILSGVLVQKLAGLILFAPAMKVMYWVALLLFFALPVVALVVWLIRRLAGARHKNNNLRYVAVGLWTLGLMATLIMGAYVFKEMDSFSSVKSTLPIQTATDTIYVRPMQNTDNGTKSTSFSFNSLDDLIVDKQTAFEIRGVHLRIESTSDSLLSVQVKRKSFGNSKEKASQNAELISFVPFFDNDNTIYIPEHFTVSKKKPYRLQHVEVTIFVPENKQVVVDKSLEKMRTFNFHFGFNEEDDDAEDYYFKVQYHDTNAEELKQELLETTDESVQVLQEALEETRDKIKAAMDDKKEREHEEQKELREANKKLDSLQKLLDKKEENTKI